MATFSEIFFKLNGQMIRSLPDNYQNIKVVSRWDGSNQEQEVEIDSLVLKGSDVEPIFNQLVQGGLGAFVGIPIEMYVRDIDVNGNSSELRVYDGMIDLSKNPKLVGCDEVEVSLTKKESIDWLSERANSFSFKYLEQEKLLIGQSDMVSIPYVINYVPEAITLVTLAITTFVMVKELVQAIKDLITTISDTIAAATPSVGFGVVIVLGAIIKLVLVILAQIAYIAAIIYAIVELVKLIIEQLIPKLRYHKGITLKTLAEKGAEFLGLTLKTTIFDNPIIANWVVMPSTTEQGSKQQINNLSGTPNEADGIYFFGDFLQVFMRMFNAEFRCRGGFLEIDRWDKFRTNSFYQIPAVYTDQERRLNAYSLNSNELKAEYLVAFTTDIQDENTLDNFGGVNYDVITEVANNPLGEQYALNKGLQEIRLPFALGNRKDELTGVEKFIKALAGIVDGLTGFFGNGTNYKGRIDNRIGSLLLSSHYTTAPKLLMMSAGKLKPNQRDYISAKFLYDYFHFINSFVPTADPTTGNIHHNQHKLYEEITVPFCKQNFVDLQYNNNATDYMGKNCEITNLEWSPTQNLAVITYRKNEQYDFNLKQTKFEPR